MVVSATFQETLAFGQIGESLIAQYLRKRGWTILPVYEKEIDNGKGPRLFLPYGLSETELIAPDIQALRNKQVKWFEAKHKSAATYYRKKQRWQTGIDKRHYIDYKRVQEITQWPVWLLFLQRYSEHNNASPYPDVEPCPAGLFGCPIKQAISDDGFYLRNGRRYDMVYWAIRELKMLASLEDVLRGVA